MIHIWSAKPNCAKLDCHEPDHVEPNQGLHLQIIMWDLRSSDDRSSSIFWDITQHKAVIPYQHFRTIYPLHIQAQEIQKRDPNITEVTW